MDDGKLCFWPVQKKKLLDSQIYPTTWTRKVKKSENEKKTKKRDMYCLDCEM